jgi:transposase InsO family protein
VEVELVVPAIQLLDLDRFPSRVDLPVGLQFRMAARSYDLAPDAIFHSDRGSNYTSQQFGRTLEALGIRRSVGRTGICYDSPVLHATSRSDRADM